MWIKICGMTTQEAVAAALEARVDAIGFVWTDPFRWARISEVLGSGRKVTVDDMEHLQTDYTSLIARQLVPLLRNLPASRPAVDTARRVLLSWDFVQF